MIKYLLILFIFFSKNILSEELPNYYCKDETGLFQYLFQIYPNKQPVLWFLESGVWASNKHNSKILLGGDFGTEIFFTSKLQKQNIFLDFYNLGMMNYYEEDLFIGLRHYQIFTGFVDTNSEYFFLNHLIYLDTENKYSDEVDFNIPPKGLTKAFGILIKCSKY